jgi:intracellular septation protein A
MINIDILVLHISLGVILFFITNWIGRHSYSIGYISMSVFARAETAPAFNLIFRVLSPTVYLIIISTILYSLELNRYVKDIYLVSAYYLLFRLAFNLVTGRGLLINWKQQILYWIFIIGLSYVTYSNLLIQKEIILPDLKDLSNELWVIILIFLYQVANNVRLSSNGTEKRKRNYLIRKHKIFEKKFGKLIDAKTDKDLLKGLFYSILLIENFNRPKIVRWVEYINFFLTRKPHTLGIMQYHTSKKITDYESVELGINKILRVYNQEIIEYKEGKREEYYGEYSLKRILSGSYNTGNEYQNEVLELWQEIMENIYTISKDAELLPKSHAV